MLVVRHPSFRNSKCQKKKKKVLLELRKYNK